MNRLTNTYVALSPGELAGAENPALLHEIHEKRRLEIMQAHRQNGVHIPCADGVLIGPAVRIGRGSVILPGTVLCGEVSVGENCELGPNSYVENASFGDACVFTQSHVREAVFGSGVTVGPFAHIRPGSVIDDNVHLGNFTEIKNSHVGAGTKVSHLTYVGDADVGQGVNFGCGVVVVNYDGKKKFRTRIDDYAFIGCNTNLVAPLHIGTFAYTAAGSTITEDVPSCALALARARQTNKTDWVKQHQPYKNKNPE